MEVSIIVAVSRNGTIGREGGLPWRLSTDLRRFKRTTMGHHLIMGRRTWESIGRPLPGRTTIVVTRQGGEFHPDVLVAAGLESALELARTRNETECFVTGGAQIYSLALEVAHRMYVTWVDAEVEGDTVFPPWSRDDWVLVEESSHPAGERDDFAHRFCVYERRAEFRTE